jgi:hypothetical protein
LEVAKFDQETDVRSSRPAVCLAGQLAGPVGRCIGFRRARRAMGYVMKDEEKAGRSNLRDLKRLLSRPRIVMGVLLIIAIPIFIGLANKAVRENAQAIRQGFGR